MQLEGLGTVVMFAVAAVLWFAYLVPVWFRRREYLATERNATRLQQTLRVMAETAEVPDAVRAEATARGAAHQERLLRERERQRAARERAALSATRAATRAELARTHAAENRAAATADRRRAGLRRGRLTASVGLLAALVAVGVQGASVLRAGSIDTVPGAVLGAAALVGIVSIGALRSLARRRIPAPVVPAVVPVAVPAAPVAASERTTREWTPVPVPKPRYLGSPVPQPIVRVPDADRLLREASEAARAALRAAHREAEVVELPSRPSEPLRETTPAPSRWSAMGLVDTSETHAPDLDEVLRRRRAAG